MDSGATNYNPEATQAGSCTYETQIPPQTIDPDEIATSLLSDKTKKLAIVNVPNSSSGYDVYFKGEEVLEYLVTFFFKELILNICVITKTLKICHVLVLKQH